jgi:two-component system, NtrC family, response regulator HupR/HoxA
MADDLKWKDFDKFHAIRRLRELVGNWFKVQVNFTDAKGLLRGVPDGKFFNPLNPICKAIVDSEKGFEDRRNTARQATIDSTKIKDAKLSRCKTGVSTLSVPIKVDKLFLGCVYGDGFLVEETAAEQKVLIKSYLDRNFDSDKELINAVDDMPVLSEKDLEYLTELIGMVVGEILATQKSLSSAEAKVTELNKELGTRYSFDQMIGKSNPMQDLYRLLDRVCDSEATVLINGENGTGKELIAKALHYNSRRTKKKFMVVNCGAFNENLLESELFGHVKGAFTGAIKDKKGMFEEADGGTLFLDEIGETSMSMQVKMLRVLQEGTFTPVGSTSMKKGNVRILAATNRDLQKMVKDGQFREDLFYRLKVINLTVPPLRERKEDIPLLLTHFLEKFAKQSGGKKEINKETIEKLLNHDWPGNVRELENETERLCVLAGPETIITADFLSSQILDNAKNKYPGYRVNGRLKDALEELEKQMIMEGLERTRWNKSKLAKELGISRAGLIMKVEKYGLDKRTV